MTWRGSIVSLECATKTTITGICWWDFTETHVYHIIQNTIFPKKKLFYIDFKHQLVYLIYSVVLTLMMQVIHIPSRQVYLV